MLLRSKISSASLTIKSSMSGACNKLLVGAGGGGHTKLFIPVPVLVGYPVWLPYDIGWALLVVPSWDMAWG